MTQSHIGIAKKSDRIENEPVEDDENLYISIISDGAHECRSIHMDGLISMRNVLE